MSELATLIPPPVTLTIGGEPLEITPFRVGKLPAMARACAPFMAVLKPGKPVDWFALVAEHGEGVFAALAIATGKPQEWVENLTADDAILLAQTVIEVNADFFIRHVLPAVTQAAEKMTAKITAGATPANS